MIYALGHYYVIGMFQKRSVEKFVEFRSRDKLPERERVCWQLESCATLY